MEKLKNDTKHLYHPEAVSHKQDSERELMKSDSWRDRSKETSTRKGGELANFTITTYQRPRDTDRIFNGDSDNNCAQPIQHMSTDSHKKPTTVFQHKYSSTNSLNGSATRVSRTNSFNSNDSGKFKTAVLGSASSVKRSTSYISLIPNPPSCHGNGFQSGQTYSPYASGTNCVGNLAVEAQLDAGDEMANENWGFRKTMSKHSVSQDPSESLQERTKSQKTVEEQKMPRVSQVGQEEPRGSQQQIIITEEERARLLAIQEQFLQLQEQLLQNSGLMQQQQQLSQPQAPAVDTPLQSLQVGNTLELIHRNTVWTCFLHIHLKCHNFISQNDPFQDISSPKLHLHFLTSV
jgi:hypothetical protein